VVVCALATALVALILTRSDVQTTFLRAPGALFQETVAGDISNLYILKLVNKTSRDIAVRLELRNSAGVVRLMGGSDSLTVDKGSSPKPRS